MQTTPISQRIQVMYTYYIRTMYKLSLRCECRQRGAVPHSHVLYCHAVLSCCTVAVLSCCTVVLYCRVTSPHCPSLNKPPPPCPTNHLQLSIMYATASRLTAHMHALAQACGTHGAHSKDDRDAYDDLGVAAVQKRMDAPCAGLRG